MIPAETPLARNQNALASTEQPAAEIFSDWRAVKRGERLPLIRNKAEKYQ
jgi:hypothetical protein